MPAKFRISPEKSVPSLVGNESGFFRIIDLNNILSGFIWLGEAWNNIFDETHEYDFIALSDGKTRYLTDQKYEEVISESKRSNVDQYLNKENCICSGPLINDLVLAN